MKRQKKEISPLTEEQKEFASENHALIYKFMHSHHLMEGDYDHTTDWYGICSIGFCKAVSTYNPEGNAQFSSYAYACMENELKMHFRHMGAKKIIHEKLKVSFERGILLEDSNEQSLENLIGEEKSADFEDDVIFRIRLQRSLETLSPRDRKIIYLLMEGQGVKKTAKQTETSVRDVMKLKTKFQKIWKKC